MNKTTILLLAGLFIASSFTAIRIINSDYNVDSDFSLVIKGTSNVHDWQSSVTDIKGTASASVSEDGKLMIDKCNITIPVEAIKSEKGSMMDKKTYKALLKDKHPEITYSLIEFETVSLNGSGFEAGTKGKLTVAGSSQTIEMTVNGTINEDQSILITGSKPLKMTDFGIDPPKALMGAMKTGNEITIEFNITLKEI